MQAKMKIEIWSDIVCPFCYIGKRKFETALEQFSYRDDVEVVWHSYQMFPDYKQQTGADFYETVGRLKGISRTRSEQMHNQIAQYAEEVGLDYNFEKILLPNTFDAHRFSLYAKTKGLQNEAEEKLFYAYFTEGRNIGDIEVLVQLGKELGLNGDEVNEALSSKQFATEVRDDIAEAQRIGVSGVPFFLINGKLAVAGAQDPQAFLDIIVRAWQEWSKENTRPAIEILKGDSCDMQGSCS
ncbi:DsbA family oxidoreductase [Pontibacter anaerobius]|uniref:DsbA family oxidoreductase n=1 Tax=Pontibacter anaerobius TaxID=2993940 RepID=A0ABT3RHG2_9BACT|nr:DsbA family oxidoreductase [Pontibacter anaerobius]MCX2740818.1 DsbA family oxidoreductase [Pontibacter anaerobius]